MTTTTITATGNAYYPQFITFLPCSDGKSVQVLFSDGESLLLQNALLIKALANKILGNSYFPYNTQVPLATFFRQYHNLQAESFLKRYLNAIEHHSLAGQAEKKQTFFEKISFLKPYVISSKKLFHPLQKPPLTVTCDFILSDSLEDEPDKSFLTYDFLETELHFALQHSLVEYADRLLYHYLQGAPVEFAQAPTLSPAHLDIVQRFGEALLYIDDSIVDLIKSNSLVAPYFTKIQVIRLVDTGLDDLLIPSNLKTFSAPQNPKITAAKVGKLLEKNQQITTIEISYIQEKPPVFLLPPHCTHLNLSGTFITDRDLAYIFENLKHLETLKLSDLEYCSLSVPQENSTEECETEQTLKLPAGLKTLEMENCPHVTSDCIASALRTCSQLIHLSLQSTSTDLATFPQLPALKKLSVAYVSKIHDGALSQFLDLHHVSHLNLSGTDIRLKSVVFPPSLQALFLADCKQLDDDDFPRAISSLALKVLDISGSSLTLAGQTPLGKSLRALNVSKTAIRDDDLNRVIAQSCKLTKLVVDGTALLLNCITFPTSLMMLSLKQAHWVSKTALVALKSQNKNITISV